MPRIAYVTGRYQPLEAATLSIKDRGLQFGDGVYIVIACVEGRLIELSEHIAHLQKYLQQAFIACPVHINTLAPLLQEVVRLNDLKVGSLYVQVTRGVAKRTHAFPTPVPKSSLIIVPSFHSLMDDPEALDEVAILFQEDSRWKNPSIKTTSLFPNVLLRQAAAQKGAFESWLVDREGKVSEGASSNAFIVTSKGHLQTRPEDGTLVPGVTRRRLLHLAEALGIPITLEAFTPDEVYQASEAFLTGATSMIKAVVRSGDRVIGSGRPGPITRKLARAYYTFCRSTNGHL